jgi:haloalkane dehalogenase
LAKANQLSDMPDFNDATKLGTGKEMVDRLTNLIAIFEDNPGVPLNREIREKLKRFDKPFLTLFGDLDPVAKGWDRRAQAHIPGAAGQNHQTIPDANHFIQEDAPEELLAHIIPFLDVN